MSTRQNSDAVIAKAKKVLQRVNELQDKNRKAEEELLLIKQQLEKERQLNQQLSEELKTTKLGAYLAGASREERTELKRKVNEMIQTIDLCIAQLSDEN